MRLKTLMSRYPFIFSGTTLPKRSYCTSFTRIYHYKQKCVICLPLASQHHVALFMNGMKIQLLAPKPFGWIIVFLYSLRIAWHDIHSKREKMLLCWMHHEYFLVRNAPWSPQQGCIQGNESRTAHQNLLKHPQTQCFCELWRLPDLKFIFQIFKFPPT